MSGLALTSQGDAVVFTRPTPPDHAVSLRETCARVGLSYSHGRRLVADGTFPVPELPRLSATARHRYSTAVIERYLAQASYEVR